jgi:hypothetical protein
MPNVYFCHLIKGFKLNVTVRSLWYNKSHTRHCANLTVMATVKKELIWPQNNSVSSESTVIE